MRTTPESLDLESGVSSHILTPEDRGSHRFWSRLRSLIPAALAIGTIATFLYSEYQIAPGMAEGSTEALFWAMMGPVAAIIVYALSEYGLNFLNRP